MKGRFLATRFLVAACIAFAVLLASQLLKGHGTDAALRFAAMWAVITSAVYVAALVYRLKRAEACQSRNAPR